MDLDNLLQEIYNDISFSNEDLENIKQNTNRHITEELEKMNTYLKKSVLEFTKKEIESLKISKIDRFNKNINTITENTLIHIAEEFDLNKEEVLEKNKDNLLQINNFHKLYEQDLNITNETLNTQVSNNTDNNTNDTDNDTDNNTNDTDNDTSNTEDKNSVNNSNIDNSNNQTSVVDTNNKTISSKKDKSTKSKKKKPIALDDTTENDNYKNHLIAQCKCPAFVKGKYCMRPPKAECGNYCGFHKKFNV